MKSQLPGKMIPPEDDVLRMAQAGVAAEWWLGDPSWAALIVGAYLDPASNATRLAQEKRDIMEGR